MRSVAKGLDKAQAEAVAQVLGAGVSLLTGGPGTGKSRTVAAIVKLLQAQGPTSPSPRRPAAPPSGWRS